MNKKMAYKCKDCGKIYLRAKWAKKHSERYLHDVQEIPTEPTISYYDLVCKVNQFAMNYTRLERKYEALEAKMVKGITVTTTTTTTIQHDTEMNFTPKREKQAPVVIQISANLRAMNDEFRTIAELGFNNHLESTELTLKNLIKEQRQEIEELEIVLPTMSKNDPEYASMVKDLVDGRKRLKSIESRLTTLL